MCTCGLPASGYHDHAWYPRRREEDAGSPKTRVTGCLTPPGAGQSRSGHKHSEDAERLQPVRS